MAFWDFVKDAGKSVFGSAEAAEAKTPEQADTERKVKALEGFGLRVAERKPLQVGHNPHNRKYLATKAGKLGHMLGQVHQGEEGAA